MARRKKEPQSVHRKNISAAAEQLFMAKGIENTSMNDIARATGYSKATLYVYFKNKEEIIRYPLYFKMVLENINIDFETRDFLPEEKETFLIGESIKQLIATYF